MTNNMSGEIAPEDVPALSSVFLGRNLAMAFVFVLVGLISFRNYKHCSYLRMWRPRRVHFRHVFGGRLLWVGIAFAPRRLRLVLNRIFCRSTDDSRMPSDPNNVENHPEMLDNATSDRVSTLDETELKELMSHITESDGGPSWQLMMDKRTPTLTYQAWSREPPAGGPTQYRTRTVFTGISPELLRDFFWDDGFRLKWEKMLVSCRTLHVCPRTGTMVVHWIRKLPLIRTEREYVIVRRIWQSESSYYCVTKGTKCPSLPNRRNTRRVEPYYSSWCINPESGNRQQHPASEVILFHREDIGIPKEIVKMLARAGMWGLVKKMEAAAQAYKSARTSGEPRSSYAVLACMTTECRPLAVPAPYPEVDKDEKSKGRRSKDGNVLKWLAVGGVLVASGLTLQVAGKVVLPPLGKWMTRFGRKGEEGRGGSAKA